MASHQNRVGLTLLFCSLTVFAAAQEVPPAPISSAPTPAAPQANPPRSARHLDDAAAVIKTVSDSSLNRDGRKRLEELQRHFAELVESYQKSPNAFADPAVGGEPGDDDNDKERRERDDAYRANWKEIFTLVERDLAGILGAGPALPGGSPANSPAIAVTTAVAPRGAVAGTTGQVPPASTGAVSPADPASAPQSAVVPGSPATADTQAATSTPTAAAATPSAATAPTAGAATTAPAGGGAVATTGVAASTGTINGGLIAGAIGVKNLDPEVRRQLEEFRLHVELFFAATTMNLEAETAR